MLVISIASGKGGTGKTTFSTSLALTLKKTQILDCDVEEPNAHFFIKPEIKKREKVTIPVPNIELSRCNYCGKCAKICTYNAIAVIRPEVLVFSELCHGCGACSYLCPNGAIYEVEKEIGYVEIGEKERIKSVHGILNVGVVMSPPLVKAVKKNIATDRINIIDAPPGTSCPMISAISNSDFSILVTEPTPFGLNDLELAVEVVRKLNIPFGVVINRANIGDKKVKEYCQKEGISILMEIPFRKEIAIAYSKGVPLVEALPEYKEDFEQLYQKISNELIKH